MTNYFICKVCLTFLLINILSNCAFSQSTTLSGGDILTQPGGLIRVVVKKDNIKTLYDMNTLTGNEVLTVHKFFDGFGRPLETIIEKVSINGSVAGNLVGFHLYDGFGRETKSFLPYLSSSSNAIYRDRGDGITGGNIQTLKRGASGNYSDDLTYNYGTNADNNQLLYVNDAGTTTGFKYTSTSSSATYTYDDNGNLLADTKKGITLEYNEQNKVTKIYKTSSTNERIEYVYDGAGMRLKKSVYNSSNTIVACENYIDGFVVDNSNALKYFAMAEGRVRYSGGTYTYEYFIKDHQGNVRISFEDNGSGVAVAHQRDDYYAFGMGFNSYHG
jgi:hypothetical protein